MHYEKYLNNAIHESPGQEPEGGHGKCKHPLSKPPRGWKGGSASFLRKVPPPLGSRPCASRDPERDGNGAETTQPVGQDDSLRMTFLRDLLKRPTPVEQVQMIPGELPDEGKVGRLVKCRQEGTLRCSFLTEGGLLRALDPFYK